MNSVLILTKVEILQAIGGARAIVEKRTGKSGAISGTLSNVAFGVIVVAAILFYLRRRH